MGKIVTEVEAREYRQKEISLYLPSEFAYHVKQVALNKRITFLELALTAFIEFIKNPIPETNLEYWRIQRRNKVYKKCYRSSLMLSSKMYNTLKDMSADRGIPVNGLMMSILREKYGKGNGAETPLPSQVGVQYENRKRPT